MGKWARTNKAEPSRRLSTKHNGENTPKNPLDQKPSFSRLTSVKLGAAVSLLRITKQKTRQKERQSLRLKAAGATKRCFMLTAHVFLSWLVFLAIAHHLSLPDLFNTLHLNF